ncbi:MAG: hypothetical protein ABJC62_03225 [Frankiaceae bacterium]
MAEVHVHGELVEGLMVQREKVTSQRGRRWVSGTLPADEYFAEARAKAKESARRTVAARLARADRPAKMNGSA